MDSWLIRTLRSEGILILAGGLTIHTFKDFSAFSEKTAKPIYKAFDKAVIDAAGTVDVSETITLAMPIDLNL